MENSIFGRQRETEFTVERKQTEKAAASKLEKTEKRFGVQSQQMSPLVNPKKLHSIHFN